MAGAEEAGAAAKSPPMTPRPPTTRRSRRDAGATDAAEADTEPAEGGGRARATSGEGSGPPAAGAAGAAGVAARTAATRPRATTRRARSSGSGSPAGAPVAEGDRGGDATAAPEDDDGVQSIKGSTRLEAKKQRRREGREQGRRRVPIITEAEFLARREAVDRVMVVRQSGERTQIGVLEDDVLVEHYVNKEQATSYGRQRLPRQGAERAAVDGGRVRRHRQGPQRGAVRR